MVIAAVAVFLLAGSPVHGQTVIGGPWISGPTFTVTATLYDNGTLRISGTGSMSSYTTGNVPWRSYAYSITNVVIEDGVAFIGNNAFNGCVNLTSVTIPNSVTYIGDWAFENCPNLTSVTIPNNVTTIGASAFSGCTGLTSMTIPNSVTTIGDGAFFGCIGLTSITIGNSVTSIGDNAFNACEGLTSITIPNSVISIGVGAFLECSNLASMIVTNPIPLAFDNSPFQGLLGMPDYVTVCLYVPEESIETYRTAFHWRNFQCFRAAESVSILNNKTIYKGISLPQISVKGKMLNVKAETNSELQIKLIDLKGKALVTFKTSGNGSFPLNKISAGRYIVEIKERGKRVNSSAIVLR
ncbi:MAG: leucine-rich repeat domain-containing protein [Treponema sp.]|nr:leucine-rich repeat domain-containing protein [Treponema sp.]